MCSVLENNQSVHVYSISCSSMEILEISFKQDFYWSINISRVIRAAVVPASTIGPQIITLPCTLHNLIVKSSPPPTTSTPRIGISRQPEQRRCPENQYSRTACCRWSMLISIQVAKDPLRFSRHTPKVYHSGNWLASQLPLSIQELPLDPSAFRPQKKERMRYSKCNNFPSVNQTNGIYCYN